MEEIVALIFGKSLPQWAVWLVVSYSAVVLAMGVDFVSGVRKAHSLGIATSSRGLKMTCTKASRYFLPMLCLTCVDAIGAVVMTVPWLTMVMAAFNVLCEWRSVMESAADKSHLRRLSRGMDLLARLPDDPRSILPMLMEEFGPSADSKPSAISDYEKD